ncbi:MAG: hypothetical protein AB7P12_19820 [Alphaproteobacteria bacterium]
MTLTPLSRAGRPILAALDAALPWPAAAYMVLVGKDHRGPVPTIDELLSGGVTALVPVPAGCVAGLQNSPVVAGYIREGVPVLLAFQAAADAVRIDAWINGGTA